MVSRTSNSTSYSTPFHILWTQLLTSLHPHPPFLLLLLSNLFCRDPSSGAIHLTFLHMTTYCLQSQTWNWSYDHLASSRLSLSICSNTAHSSTHSSPKTQTIYLTINQYLEHVKNLIKDYSIGSINGNQYSSALHDDLLPLCSLYRTSTAGKREQLKCATHTEQNNKIKKPAFNYR